MQREVREGGRWSSLKEDLLIERWVREWGRECKGYM